ncbi:MAG: OmpA family protein [Candidatus Cyclobacteriaceae bacterium M3_2C_046]
MSKRLFLFFLLVSHFGYSQNIQWATKVLEYSSQLSPYEYSATQVLKKPDVLPNPGDNPNAWLPNKPDDTEFIKVGFDYPMQIQQIAIAESYNPSAVYQVYVYDRSGNEFLINTFTPRPIELKGRMLNIYIDETDYEVHAVKVVLNGQAVPGYSGIDAIGVSDSKIPIEVELEIATNVKTGLKTERLGENINSSYQEMRPLIAPDGKTLYFSRSFSPDNMGGEDDPEDIWFSELDEGSGDWQQAQNIGAPLNNAGPNYISSITPDGKSMVVLLGNEYTNGDKMKPGVSVSTKTSEGWSEPEELDIINSYIENKDGNYFLANNRKTLIMAIERYDTHGGKDLYVSFRQDNGKWTEPMNLGNDINTAHDDLSPFLAADDETLYFSSKGFSGFGGSDIYISRRLDATWQNWTTPENLGSDINSNADDVFFNIPPSGTYAYFTKGMSETDADIHRIELPIFYQPAPVVAVSGSIYNSESNEPIEAQISYELLPEETEIGLTLSDGQTGNYQILLPSGASYRYQVYAMGFKPKTETISLREQEDYNEIEKNIFLEPSDEVITAADDNEDVSGPTSTTLEAAAAKPAALQNAVYFNFNADDIQNEYTDELQQIAQYMKQNPEEILEIQGHTDRVGDHSYNMRLSQRRANSVYNYLVQQGIAKDRMIVVSYGEVRPKMEGEGEQARSENRRVEFELLR